MSFHVRFEAKDLFALFGEALVGFFVVCSDDFVWRGFWSAGEIEVLRVILHGFYGLLKEKVRMKEIFTV